MPAPRHEAREPCGGGGLSTGGRDRYVVGCRLELWQADVMPSTIWSCWVLGVTTVAVRRRGRSASGPRTANLLRGPDARAQTAARCVRSKAVYGSVATGGWRVLSHSNALCASVLCGCEWLV